jgi:predicted permease
MVPLGLLWLPRVLRSMLREPEPMDAAGSRDLAELYAAQRRRRVLGMFWLNGVAGPLVIGGIFALVTWFPNSGAILGIIGGVGGTALGIAGAVFGLQGTALAVVVMMGALPVGSNALIFAQRYRVLQPEATAAIVVSTGCFMASAALWLALLAWWAR